MDACAGNGANVAVGVIVGSLGAATVLVEGTVGVKGLIVTGKAVGTGPGGLMVFLT